MRKRFQDYLARLFSQPIVDQFQTPARRRAIAIGVMLIHLLAIIAIIMVTRDITWPLIPVGIAAIYLIAMLNMATRGIFELADDRLDEFQIALRDSAFRRAYYFVLLWMLLAAPVLGVLEGSKVALLYSWAYLLLGFMWGMALPRVIVAWTQPAELNEEE